MLKINFLALFKNALNGAVFSFCFLAITGFSEQLNRPLIDIYNEAIAIKSTDPKLSQQLLFRLNYRREELTVQQRIELIYLTGYLETMRGKYYRAIDVHRNLALSEHPHIALRANADMLLNKVLLRDYGGASQYAPNIIAIINDKSLNLPSNIVHNALIILVSFYNQLGQYELANIYLNALYKSSLTPRQQCYAEVQRTQTDIHLGKITLTDNSIIETKKLCLSIDESALVQNYIADLAYIYIEKEMYTGAINLLNQELDRSSIIYHTLNKAEYNAYLACSYMHLDDFTLALKYARETLKHVDNLNEPLPKTWAYDVLYQVSLRQKDTLNAIKYLKLYSNAYDEYKQIIHLKSLGIEQGKHGLTAIEDDVALYSKELQLNNSMQIVEQEGNEAFHSYQLIQLTIEVLFLLFFSYQFYSIYQVRKNIKVAIKNLVYDPTTHAYHRHEFIKQASTILTQQTSDSNHHGLLILNLDDMARINLHHNSDRGEWVIKYGIRACQKVCTKNEIIGRLGGNEFAILMINQSFAEMKLLTDEILQVFQQLDTSKVSYRFDSNCSIGWSETDVSGSNLQQLIKDADLALRAAKEQGKNRVVHISDINLYFTAPDNEV